MAASNPGEQNPLGRYFLSRAPGVLFATAALLLSFSGVAAPDLSSDLPDTQGGDDTATTGLGALAAATTTGTGDADATGDADGRLSFRTGDRLTADQLAEYRAYVAALQEKGQHRGVTVMSSW